MQYNFQVDIIGGEYWWGGLVADGTLMPFSGDELERSLCPISTENQTMPFLISNKGRYIWCNEPFDFKFAADKLYVSSRYDEIILSEGHTSLKRAYLDASKKFFPVSASLPEKRLFTHPQYNTWIELMYDQTQEKIHKYASDIIKKGYPSGVLMIDDNWQEDYGVFSFHQGRFKDPKRLIDQLHEMGFLVMLWVSPFVSPDCMVFRELEAKNMLVKDAAGNTAIRRWWNGFSGILDLTNPATENWLKQELDSLMETYGIDGFKFDAGDPQYYSDEDMIYSPGNAQKQCNAYNRFGAQYTLNEFRGAFKAAGLPLVQRLCDKSHTWVGNGLDTLIPNGLAQGLMGYIYTCPDMIGGGQYLNFLPESLNIDEELVVRYAQCSALFPMMQFSVAPWRVLSPANDKICLNMAKLHEQFGDYILDVTMSSGQSGEPIMRHLAYAYGEGYEHVRDQFLIGDQLMVAPVITKQTFNREVLIPEGQWKADDDMVYNGPTRITIDVPLERLPYFIKC